MHVQVAKKEWMESVQLVFDYFCERTPRSFVEAREPSVIWNYKYAGLDCFSSGFLLVPVDLL